LRFVGKEEGVVGGRSGVEREQHRAVEPRGRSVGSGGCVPLLQIDSCCWRRRRRMRSIPEEHTAP